MATEAECLDALREAARELGSSPTKAEYEALGLTPASATIIRTVGGWNEAKERAGLATNASTGSRVGPPPEGVDDEIRECWAELSVDQRWHYRNVEWNTERTLQRRSELREWLDEQRAAAGCSRCGESDPRCLDFHHRDSESKRDSISEMVTRGASKRPLREEIVKCVVICVNCHRAEHDDLCKQLPNIELREGPLRLVEPDGDYPTELTQRERQRVWVRSYKERGGCRNCGTRQGPVLDLHHVDSESKTASVGRMVSDGCSLSELRKEVDRCEVMCANCHRKLHAERNN